MTTEELALEVERLRGVLARIEALVWYEPDDDDDLVEAVRVMACERDEARAEIHVAVERLLSQGVRAEVERLRRERDEDIVESTQKALSLVAAERDAARAEVERLRKHLEAASPVTVEIARLRDALKRIESLVWYEPDDEDDLVEAVRAMRRERDEALSQIMGRQAEIAELHAEVERLRARVRSVDRSTDYEGKAFDDSPSSQEDLAIVASERDEARAEVERLRREHDHERTVANEQLARAHDAVRERDEAIKQSRHAWDRQAEKDRAYGEALRERDEARAEVERLRAAYDRYGAAGVASVLGDLPPKGRDE